MIKTKSTPATVIGRDDLSEARRRREAEGKRREAEGRRGEAEGRRGEGGEGSEESSVEEGKVKTNLENKVQAFLDRLHQVILMVNT